VPTPRYVSISCFICEKYKTHPWRSSNVCHDQGVAMGCATILDRAYSHALRSEGSIWLIHDFLCNYLLLNRSSDPLLLLIIALARDLLLGVVSQLGSCYPVLSDQYPHLCLILISCGFSSSSSLDFLSFRLKSSLISPWRVLAVTRSRQFFDDSCATAISCL
jgi:hypothetical protein